MDRLREIIQEDQPERDPLLVEFERQSIILQMSHRNGRRFVWMIMNESAPTRNPMGIEDRWTNFNVGKQDIGRWLLFLIHEYCPDMYTLMIKESKEDEDHDHDSRNAANY